MPRYEDDPDFRPANTVNKDAFLRECVEIDPAQLNDEFIRIPGDLAYWSNAYAAASRDAAVAKLDYERAWAQLYLTLKAENAGNKGATVDWLKAACDNDPDVYDAQLLMIEKEAEKVRLRGMVDAVIAKKDMVQSLGAKLREEMRGDPTLRANALTG